MHPHVHGSPVRHPAQAWWVLVVALLHAGLLWTLWPDRARTEGAQPVPVRLLQAVRLPDPEPAAPPTSPAAPGLAPRVLRGAAEPGLRTPDHNSTARELITVLPPAVASARPADQAHVMPATPEPSEPPASAPLNLKLPRGSSARWSGTLREGLEAWGRSSGTPSSQSLESRITSALGGADQISEARLQDGTLRLRRGAACVLVRPSKAGELDPYNKAVQAKPGLVEAC